MFLNEKLDQWEALDSQCEESAVEIGQSRVTCCSTHLTTFTVQEVFFVEGYNKYQSNGVVTPAEESTPLAPHLVLIMSVNFFLLISVVTGCCLDSKQRLIFTPMQQ